MKLYDVPRNSKIKLEDGTVLDFRHIDGMYSLCYYKDKPVHLAAWTEVAVVPEGEAGHGLQEDHAQP